MEKTELNLSEKINQDMRLSGIMAIKDVKEFIKRDTEIVGKVCVRVLNAKWIKTKEDACICIEREIKEEQNKLAGEDLI